MIEEELPDELENDLDDIEPVGDESQLYEHFRVVVDKGQAMVRVDKYSNVLSTLRVTAFRRLPKTDSLWLTASR